MADEIIRDVHVALSAVEANAMLWAVRNLSLESLRDGPYHGTYGTAAGHAELSSATNEIERALSAALAARSDVAKTRALVDLVLARTGTEHDPETVALVLMLLDSHYLLKEFPGTPAEYHDRVQRAFADALRAVTQDDTTKGT